MADIHNRITDCIELLSHSFSIGAYSIIVLLLLFSSIIYATLSAYNSLTNSEIESLQTKQDSISNYIVQHLTQAQLLRLHSILFVLIVHSIAAGVFLYILYPHFANAPYTIVLALAVFFIVLQLSKALFIPIALIKPLWYIYSTHKLLRASIMIMKPLYFIWNSIKPQHQLILLTARNFTLHVAETLHVSTHEINQEKDMIEGIAKLQHKSVSNIMTPRVDVFAVDIHTNFLELMLQVVNSGYSRVPIYDNTLDNITGILYVKDLLPHIAKPENFEWHHIVRPAYFIPKTKKNDDLLKEFQKTKTHIAIVVDEYGGTSGVITLEDILEEIVGEINDELDDEEEILYEKISDTLYACEGKILIDDVIKILNLDEDFFDEHREDTDSLAGFILKITGEFPKVNDIIPFKHLKFIIAEGSDRKITKINCEITHDTIIE